MTDLDIKWMFANIMDIFRSNTDIMSTHKNKVESMQTYLNNIKEGE